MSQIPFNSFVALSKPKSVFEFDFSGRTKIETIQNVKHLLTAEQNGIAHAVFVWWELKMDVEGEIILSCAPHWSHPDISNLIKTNTANKPSWNLIPWRDHWMQAIYHLPKDLKLTKGQQFDLFCNHDEYLFWFDVDSAGNKDIQTVSDPPACSESFYLINSRTRIGQLNDHIRNKKYLAVLENTIDKNSIVLSISDGSLLGLAAAPLGARHVYLLQENQLHRDVMTSYVETNNLTNVTIINSLDDLENIETITHFFAEPYFMSSILPWDNLYYFNLLRRFRGKLNKDTVIIPQIAKIHAVPVLFTDLQKIRAPLGKCEGFDMKIFDEMIDNASDMTDEYVEAQPLWEYPCKPVGKSDNLLTVDINTLASNSIFNEGSFEIFGYVNIFFF